MHSWRQRHTICTDVFINSPWRGAISGAISTAIIQSPSTTTITAAGCVAASLLSLPQALDFALASISKRTELLPAQLKTLKSPNRQALYIQGFIYWPILLD